MPAPASRAPRASAAAIGRRRSAIIAIIDEPIAQRTWQTKRVSKAAPQTAEMKLSSIAMSSRPRSRRSRSKRRCEPRSTQRAAPSAIEAPARNTKTGAQTCESQRKRNGSVGSGSLQLGMNAVSRITASA